MNSMLDGWWRKIPGWGISSLPLMWVFKMVQWQLSITTSTAKTAVSYRTVNIRHPSTPTTNMLSSSIPRPGCINSDLQIPQTCLQATSPERSCYELLKTVAKLPNCQVCLKKFDSQINQIIIFASEPAIEKKHAKNLPTFSGFPTSVESLWYDSSWLPTVTVLPSKATKETLESPFIHSSTLRPAFEEDSQRRQGNICLCHSMTMPWVHLNP